MRTQRKGVKTLLLLGITGTLSRFFPRCSAAAVPSREERRPWHEVTNESLLVLTGARTLRHRAFGGIRSCHAIAGNFSPWEPEAL
jgi:hypothetical protein